MGNAVGYGRPDAGQQAIEDSFETLQKELDRACARARFIGPSGAAT